MGKEVKTVFEAAFVDDPPISGEVGASVWEVIDGKAVSSNHVIQLGNDWVVRVNWHIEGALASCICGDWCLHLFMESIGDAPEFQYPDPKIEEYKDVHVDLDPCKPLKDNKYHYSQDLRVPNHYVRPEHCATPYKPVVALTYRDACKRPGPMAGFVELPTVQFYEVQKPGQTKD